MKGKAGFAASMTIYISKSAEVFGDVSIGNGSSIWHGAVLRGDLDKIEIGKHTNIQDNGVIHLDVGFPAVVGERVTVGHLAVIHGCTVGSDCVIGMGSVIGNDATIDDWSIVAPGAVVPESSRFPEGSVIAGVPAKKELSGDSSKRVRIRVADEIAKIIRDRTPDGPPS